MNNQQQRGKIPINPYMPRASPEDFKEDSLFNLLTTLRTNRLQSIPWWSKKPLMKKKTTLKEVIDLDGRIVLKALTLKNKQQVLEFAEPKGGKDFLEKLEKFFQFGETLALKRAKLWNKAKRRINLLRRSTYGN